MKKTFGLIGGDRRQAELARLLAADGHTVRTYGLDRWKPGGETSLAQAASAGIVILPLPLCKGDGVLNCEEGPVPTTDLFRRLRPEQRILAGQVKPQQLREAKDRELVLEDYFLREELTVANAAATAEACSSSTMSTRMTSFPLATMRQHDARPERAGSFLSGGAAAGQGQWRPKACARPGGLFR